MYFQAKYIEPHKDPKNQTKEKDFTTITQLVKTAKQEINAYPQNKHIKQSQNTVPKCQKQ